MAMMERRPWLDALSHAVLLLGIAVVVFPVYVAFIASTHAPQDVMQAPMPLWPGDHLLESYRAALLGAGRTNSNASVTSMLGISLAMTMIITIGKISVSLLSAFAVVFFRFPLRQWCFWTIFITLMLPVEVRIGPTYQVVSDLGLVNSLEGLAMPLIASATATFLFRQFFLTVPDELVEAARIDGASPMRFFRDILLPLSGPNIAALFVIQFIYGWNQYLWPLIVATSENMYPIMVGLKQMIGSSEAPVDWNVIMATAMLAMLPPVLVVVLLQKWFVKGLVDSEK